MKNLLLSQWQALSEAENDFLVNSSQFCAFIMQQVDDISWAGFYWHRQQQLVVGAYQGPVACTRIDLEKGVCGTAFSSAKTQIVADVNQFSGHISCDSNSASELVVPVIHKGKTMGVFDIDSYTLNRFDEELVETIEELVKEFVVGTDLKTKDWPA